MLGVRDIEAFALLRSRPDRGDLPLGSFTEVCANQYRDIVRFVAPGRTHAL